MVIENFIMSYPFHVNHKIDGVTGLFHLLRLGYRFNPGSNLLNKYIEIIQIKDNLNRDAYALEYYPSIEHWSKLDQLVLREKS